MRKCLFWVMAVAFLLASCDQVSKYQGVDMSSRNAVPLTDTCVGQFELQLPKTGREWNANFDWAEVSRLSANLRTDRDFRDFVEQRRDYLASQKHDVEPSLLSYFEWVGDNAALLLHRQEDTNRSAYYLERYLWLGDRGYLFKGLGEGDEIKGKLEGYKQVFSKLTPLTDSGSTRPGFCIDGALVGLVFPDIDVVLSVRPNGLPNTAFFVGTTESSTIEDISKYPQEDPESFGAFGELKSDQQRFKQAERDSNLSSEPTTAKEFKILREGHKIVAKRNGDEAIWKKTLNNGASIYEFRWSVSDSKPSLHDNPSLSLRLSSGDEMKPDDKAVPEEHLIALWDAVLDSARKR